jgi:hypothetical protein
MVLYERIYSALYIVKFTHFLDLLIIVVRCYYKIDLKRYLSHWIIKSIMRVFFIKTIFFCFEKILGGDPIMFESSLV